jgi:hypothetical protein
VAERSGVSKIVLEQELRLQPRRYEGPGASQAPRRDPAPPVAEPDGARAEEEILRLMIYSPAWRERARELHRASHFDVPAHAELFTALTKLPPAEPATQLPDSLSHEAKLRWIELRKAAYRLEGADLDAIFTSTSAMILSRFERREIDGISDPVERRRREDDLRRRYPKAEQARWLQRKVRKKK